MRYREQKQLRQRRQIATQDRVSVLPDGNLWLGAHIAPTSRCDATGGRELLQVLVDLRLNPAVAFWAEADPLGPLALLLKLPEPRLRVGDPLHRFEVS